MVVFLRAILHQKYFFFNYLNAGFKVYILSIGDVLLKREQYLVAH